MNPIPAERAPSSRRGPTPAYAAREQTLDGPIWTVPDLPEAVMPDLRWALKEEPRRRPAVMIRRQRANTTGEDTTQALPSLDNSDQSKARPRPRPRPRPGTGQPDPRSTVYVSRHAAEPS